MNITKIYPFFVVFLILLLASGLSGTTAISFASPLQHKSVCSQDSAKSTCGFFQENTLSSSDYVEASQEEIAILGKESFHANIAMLEKALKERGVNTPEKGFITSELRAALIAFQESVSLPATGQINSATLEKLGVKF